MITPQETLVGMNHYFAHKVKPALQEGNIPEARRCVANLFLEMQFSGMELLVYHSGITAMSVAEMVLGELKQGRLPIERSVRELEAYLAQWKLAAASGNRG
jgi:hypothetical protein